MANKNNPIQQIHKEPADFQKVLSSDINALTAWENITALARNEWICWIESAKKQETRIRRIERACEDLKGGKRRPCCWPGCPHRNPVEITKEDP